MRGRLSVPLFLLLSVLLPVAAAADVYVISDFETAGDLAQWEPTGAIVYCPDGWCESNPATLSRVADHATSGSYSCLVEMPPPPTDYPGMTLISFPITDWSPYDVLRMDFDNPNSSALVLHVELSDSVQGSGWAKRYYTEVPLIPGANHIEIDLHNLPRNEGSGDVDTAHVGRFLFYATGFSTDTDVYCDYIRLETITDDPWADVVRGIYKFDFGTASSRRYPDFFRVTAADAYAASPGWGWTDSSYRYSGDNAGPDDLCRDFVRPLPCCPTSEPMDFRVDIPNGTYTVYAIARSGELHGMPVLGWQILAEGAVEVDVPMDSATFYSTDYYYRGKDEDYPLSQPYFEKFVETNYPAYQFTTTVSDGSLDLSIYRAWAYMLVVYPTSLEAEMGPRLAGWEAERRDHFESAYYVAEPADLTFALTGEETARGYAAWPIATMDPVYPDTLPPSPRPALELSAAAAQDEYRPVNLAIRPLSNLTGVSIEASDLSDGVGHTIPSSEIECQYVRYMVTPDTEFFGSGVLSWKPRLLQSDFPIAVEAQVSKQFWVTFHVPPGTAAGTYTGTVTVRASTGDLAVPVALEVWSLQLDSADEMAYGWYYTSPDSRYCFNTLWFADKADAADEMLRLDLAHMQKHGYNSLQFPSPRLSLIDPDTGWPGIVDETQRDRYVAAMQDTGFGGDWKGQVGTIDIANQILGNSSVTEFDANFDAAFKEALRSMQSSCEDDGYQLAMYLVDEPRESMIQPWNRNFADTMEYCDLANQVLPAVTSTVTVMADSQEGVDYTPIGDDTDIIQTHPWPNSAGLITGAIDQEKPIWFYNTGGDLRMVYGFYQYTWGNGCWEWHFDWLDEGWDPFPYSPFNNHWHYTYPSPEGPVATLSYEWGSLGITDYRYAATLARMSAQARASGEPDLVTWADQADALLQALRDDVPDYAVDGSYEAQHFAGIADGPGCLTEVDAALEAYRREIATLILALPGPIPGAECEVVEVECPETLEWGATAQVAVTVRNIGSDPWLAGDGYELVPADGCDRWGITSVPLAEEIAPDQEYRFEFTIVAPAWTTLAYPIGAENADPGELVVLSCDWTLMRGGDPVSGGTITHEIAVSRFPDVQPGTAGGWARFYVEECAGRVPVLMQGYPDGSYGPEISVTRDAMAVFIRRALALDLVSWQDTFSDVPDGFWAGEDIEALVDAGVVSGYPDGTYRPGGIITRDQMPVYVARALSYDLPEVTEDLFLDVPVGFWADQEIKACIDHGVVGGYPDGYYQPAWLVSRDQMATFIYRAFVCPTSAAIVLAGPAVTSFDLGSEIVLPGEASYYGWPTITAGYQDDPGWAYVAFDAARMYTGLGETGNFEVTFTLRDSGGMTVAHHVVDIGAAAIAAANDAAGTTGVPYLAVGWAIPGALPPATYQIEVGSTAGALLEETIEFAVGPGPD